MTAKVSASNKDHPTTRSSEQAEQPLEAPSNAICFIRTDTGVGVDPTQHASPPPDLPSDVADLPFPADPSAIFRKANYKVRMVTGLSQKDCSPCDGVVDTGAGPNLVDQRTLPPHWLKHVQPFNSDIAKNLVGAEESPLNIRGVFPLYVRMGKLRCRVWCGVVPKLAVPVLLGTSFIDKFIKTIDVENRRIMPRGSHAVPILGIGTSDVAALVDPPAADSKRSALPEDFEPDNIPRAKIALSQTVVIPPMTQSPVHVTCPRPGFHRIVPNTNTMYKHNVCAAHGVMDIPSNAPFHILMSNFGHSPVTLPRGMIVASATDPPETVIPIADDTWNKVLLSGQLQLLANDVNVVSQYKKITQHEKEAARQKTMEKHQQKDETAPDSWHDKVRIGSDYQPYRKEILEMLEPFSSMWDGHLGLIRGVEHRIELKPGTRPFHSSPYRAGPDLRQFEGHEIERLVADDVAEPAIS